MMANEITREEFVLLAIRSLRKPPYKGIHAVYSGFNSAFRDHFEEDARPTVDRMAAEGQIETRLVRGGPMLYLPGEKPASTDVLGKILGGA